jgi:hypothetical protein
MAYIPNIPLATDPVSVSQGQIQGNFNALSPVVNGVINFLPTSPFPTIPGGNDALFGGIPTVPPLTTLNEIFITKQILAASPITFPMTAALFANSGYTYLPSGILIKWGFVAPSLPNPCTVTYDATIPFTQVFNVSVSVDGATGATDPNWFATIVASSVLSQTAFFQVVTTQRTSSTPTAVQLFYMAIGKAF